MDFKPFALPPSDHHGLNTGLGTENGVSARGLVEGVNACFKHLFEALSPGKKSDDAGRIAELEESLAAAHQRNDALDANVKALLASFDKLQGQVAHIESVASDWMFKVDALERRLNDKDNAEAAAKAKLG